MALTFRIAQTRDDAVSVADLLANQMYPEVGPQRCRLNWDKGFYVISLVIQDGGCGIVEDDGLIVGTYGMQRTPWWCSDDLAWFSLWFYVKPEYRAGAATRLMFENIADRVEDEQTPAFIHISEKPKARTAKLRQIGEEIGFAPNARILLIDDKD